MQDNKSIISLHKNYPYSVGKGSKHIHVRYFFIVDCIEKKEMKLLYYPTEEMIIDYSSKPTQGALFIWQRNVIQGINENIFPIYKAWYRRVLERYGLWDNLESDLADL